MGVMFVIDDERLRFEPGMRVEVLKGRGKRAAWLKGTITALSPQAIELKKELALEEQKKQALEVTPHVAYRFYV